MRNPETKTTNTGLLFGGTENTARSTNRALRRTLLIFLGAEEESASDCGCSHSDQSDRARRLDEQPYAGSPEQHERDAAEVDV
jgi:hypothetical protein